MTEITKTYMCGKCGKTYEVTKEDDALAEEEYKMKFTEEERKHDEPVTICDDCYQIIMNQ